ncbi:MAG: glycosyltransferase family 9 protein [Bacteroidia bacterium]
MKRVAGKFKNIFIQCIEALFFSKKLKEDNNNIILLRLDQIGDYILFRNFIEEIFNHYNCKSKIVLCGNIIWKDLADRLDKGFIHEFIWVDVALLNKPFYLFSIYSKLSATKCSTLIYSAYSRTVEGDNLATHSGARQIIGWDGDETNISRERKTKNNLKYTKLIPSSSECMFEFFRNKIFFEKVLNKPIAIDEPFIKTNPEKQNHSKQYIMVFPGAGHQLRRWNPANFAALYKLIHTELKLPILIGGSVKDKAFAQEMVSLLGPLTTDLTGNMNLSEMVDSLQNATISITNDSGPLHISLALKTPVVCISNGNNYGRFCPYPESMNAKLAVVYPDEIDKALMSEDEKKKLCCRESFIDINSISPEKVFQVMKKKNFLN